VTDGEFIVTFCDAYKKSLPVTKDNYHQQVQLQIRIENIWLPSCKNFL